MRSIRLAAMVCVATLSATALVSAQSSQPSVPPLTEQIEVVATRLPETPHEVPAAIEVIGGDFLRATGARTLQHALMLAAGVDVTPSGDNGPASSVPEFRGLREFDAFLLVVDDVPWGGAFNPALATLNLRDIERIEILRGPAPVTYGATSFVGVIHVVHKPGTETRRYFNARAGSFGSAGAGVDLPVAGLGDWQSRLSVDAERDGYSDDQTSYTRGHALWRSLKSRADRRMWFSGDLNWINQNPASPHPRQGSGLSPLVPLDANHNPGNAFFNDTRVSFAYGFDRPISNGARWATIASFSHSGQDIFRGFLADIVDAPSNARGLRQKIDTTDIYADSHVSWPAMHDVTFIAGADFLHGLGESTGATFDYTTPLSGHAPDITEPTDLNLRVEDRREFFGAYSIAEWKPSPRVTVSGGLRLNVTFEERGGEEEAQKAEGEKDEGQTHVKPSGSIGALFTLWSSSVNHIRAYGTFRSTFKPAAFDFGLGEGEEEEGGEGLLDPETALDYEGGLKIRTLDGRVDLEADLFRMDFENLVTATVVNGVPALQNSGKTRFRGIEFASDLHVAPNVTVRGTYSFHRSTFVDFVQAFDGVPTQLAGKRLEMSPEHLFGAGIVYAATEGLLGNFAVKYVGSRYLNKRNTALADAYTILDAGAGYRFDRWELRVDGRNLTDQRDPVSESELGDAQYYRMLARRIEASVALRF